MFLSINNAVKYLGLTLDRKLTWKAHIIAKKNHINMKLRQMNWLISRKFQLSTENKLLLHKCILKPIWTYGVQLWGCAKPSNNKILQRIQSQILRKIHNAPWYISNKTLHDDSGIPYIEEEINRLKRDYLKQFPHHPNEEARQLYLHPEGTRRLKRQWTTDALLIY